MGHKLNIHHVLAVKKFGKLEPTKVSTVEEFLTHYVSLPTAKKYIGQMIDIGIIKLDKSELDKRVRLVTFLIKDVDDLI